MAKILISLLGVCCFAAAAQQAASLKALEVPKTTKHSMTQKMLLEKIKKAADPKDVAKNWKTMTIKMQLGVPMQQHSLTVTTLYKIPNKMKVAAEMPGVPVMTEVYNGKRAWKETAGLGIEEKTGKQLAFAEFSCKKSDPALELTDVYAKVELDPYLYKVGDFSCYKLICSLPEKLNVPPTQLFFDDKEFLTRYSIEFQLTDMGVVPVATTISEYKDIEGIKFPMRTDMNMLGIRMQAQISSVKINEKIPDTEFQFPESKDGK